MCQRDKKLYKEGERERLRGLEIKAVNRNQYRLADTNTHTRSTKQKQKACKHMIQISLLYLSVSKHFHLV